MRGQPQRRAGAAGLLPGIAGSSRWQADAGIAGNTGADCHPRPDPDPDLRAPRENRGRQDGKHVTAWPEPKGEAAIGTGPGAGGHTGTRWAGPHLNVTQPARPACVTRPVNRARRTGLDNTHDHACGGRRPRCSGRAGHTRSAGRGHNGGGRGEQPPVPYTCRSHHYPRRLDGEPEHTVPARRPQGAGYRPVMVTWAGCSMVNLCRIVAAWPPSSGRSQVSSPRSFCSAGSGLVSRSRTLISPSVDTGMWS
jgi:hypothetical protein